VRKRNGMESWGGERSRVLREAKLPEDVLMTQAKTVRTCLVRRYADLGNKGLQPK
jgi:hypothetical protein